MQFLSEFGPWLAAMGALVVASGFFSASEAALFYLRRQDRRDFESGGPAQRTAADLLGRPDRLLSAILFWNLLVNVAYFALSAIVSLDLERREAHGHAGGFAVAALFVLIFFGEMVPKTLGVLATRQIAAWVSFPLAVTVRALDLLMPIFRFVEFYSRRLLSPRFVPETYLELNDLERAIELSTGDAALVEQERTVLRNVVALSEIRVDEVMRPRTRLATFRPPITLDALGGRLTPSNYLLASEPESDDVAGAIPLLQLWDVPDGHLEHYAERVVYLPWCAVVATALEEMRKTERNVVAVVNELGETIGIVTYEDVMELVLGRDGVRGRSSQTAAIEEVSPGVWRATGMTSLRRIARHFGAELPESKAVTVAGMLQEVLQRMPSAGDECSWGPFDWKVLAAPDHGRVIAQLSRRIVEEESRP